MKKRIISSLLSILLLFACLTPAVLAVDDCDDTSHEAFHAAVAELRNLAKDDLSEVYFGNAEVNNKATAIDNMLKANSALAESVKDEADYTYFTSVHAKYRAKAAVYTDEYVPAYDAAVTALGANNANIATKDYYDAYNNAKTAFDKFDSREKAFVKNYKESRKKAGEKGLICIPSGNHDMDRLARTLHGDELKVAFAFLLTMPGAPFIYYGDEIGLRYVENLVSVEGGYSRTGSRSPMQWNHGVNFGFSNASP